MFFYLNIADFGWTYYAPKDEKKYADAVNKELLVSFLVGFPP